MHFAKVASSVDFTLATKIRRFDSAGASQRLLASQGTDATSPIRPFNNSVSVNDVSAMALVASRVNDQRRALYRYDGVQLTELALANRAGPITGIDFSDLRSIMPGWWFFAQSMAAVKRSI